jgi:hypothetical protein
MITSWNQLFILVVTACLCYHAGHTTYSVTSRVQRTVFAVKVTGMAALKCLPTADHFVLERKTYAYKELLLPIPGRLAALEPILGLPVMSHCC